MTPPRVCPECGADRWKMKDASRTFERLSAKTRDVEKLARENGLLRYKLEIAEAEYRDHQSHQSRKIVRQARVIKRLEERLRAAGVRPYEGAGLGEVSTGAEFDAAVRAEA